MFEYWSLVSLTHFMISGHVLPWRRQILLAKIIFKDFKSALFWLLCFDIYYRFYFDYYCRRFSSSTSTRINDIYFWEIASRAYLAPFTFILIAAVISGPSYATYFDRWILSPLLHFFLLLSLLLSASSYKGPPVGLALFTRQPSLFILRIYFDYIQHIHIYFVNASLRILLPLSLWYRFIEAHDEGFDNSFIYIFSLW